MKKKTIPKKALLIALSLLTLTLLASWLAGPTYRGFKRWRAQSLAAQAIEYLEEGAIEDAWRKAETSYKLFPNDSEVSRAVALIYEKIEPKRALAFWEITVNLTGQTEDVKSLIRNAMILRHWDIVEQQLDSLQKNNITDDTIELFKAQSLINNRQWIEGLTLSKKLAAQNNASPESVLLYGELSKIFPAERKFAVDKLKKLFFSDVDYKYQLQAFKILMDLPGLSIEDLLVIQQQLNKQNNLTTSDKLSILAYKLQFLDADSDDILQEAKMLFDLNNPVQKVEWGRWLNQQGWADKTIDAITLKEALSRQDLFLVWMDAQAIEDNWRNIQSVLENEKLPLEEYLEMLFKARTYNELGKRSYEEAAWGRVHALIAENTQQLFYVLRYAMRLNLEKQVRKVFERLTEIHSTRQFAYNEWLIWERRKRNTEGMLRVLNEMVRIYPDNPSVRNDWIYTRLLLDIDIKRGLEDAIQLVVNNPPYLAHRMTLALAYYKNEDYQSALKTLEDSNINQFDLNSSYKALYAAILEGNDQTSLARTITSEISSEAILPEEENLY